MSNRRPKTQEHAHRRKRGLLDTMVRWIFKPVFWFLGKRLQSASRELASALREELKLRTEIRRGAPDPNLAIEPINHPIWLTESPHGEWIESLTKLGFKDPLAYRLPRQDHEFAMLQQPEHKCVAALHQAGEMSLCEIYATNQSSESRSVVNFAAAIPAALPPWHRMELCESNDANQIFQSFLTNHDSENATAIGPDDYPQVTKEFHRRLVEWKAERGGKTRKELEKAQDVVNEMPKDADERKGFLAVARRQETERHLCAWWKLQPDAPCPLEDVIESLLIIHNEVTPEMLHNDYLRESGDLKFRRRYMPDGPVRKVFRELIAANKIPLKRVMEKKTGLQADFYLPE